MIQQNVLFTVEIYGFSGQYNQAFNFISRAILELKPEAKALFIEEKSGIKDLEGDAQEYIKIIYSDRRLALKLCKALESSTLFDSCYVGIFPFKEAFRPGKKTSWRERRAKSKNSKSKD
ncbi:MAG: hypothetical protein WC441_01475 [Patescibacteria group bacterium]